MATQHSVKIVKTSTICVTINMTLALMHNGLSLQLPLANHLVMA